MNQPLRIVIDVRIADGVSGGVQQWILGLADALSNLDSDTEEYLFLVERGNETWLRPHIRGSCQLVLRDPARGSSRTSIWPQARALAARLLPPLRDLWRHYRPAKITIERSDGLIELLGADVVHFPQQTACLTTIPSLYQPWDLQHLHLPDFFSRDVRMWRDLTYRAFCNQATVVVTATNWVKRDVAEQYGIRPERIAVINVPPPTDAYAEPTPQAMEAVAKRLGLPDRFIFYPAQTWPHKNHSRLLLALARLASQGLTVPLICSGHLNEHASALEAEASRLRIATQVRFLGFLDPMDVQTLYRRARALVFPSLYEGWGLPIVEAFRSDLPVACSNVTSLPELVGNAALVFDPLKPDDIAGAIRQLWIDDGLATELARRGRSVVDQLSWHDTAVLMRAQYRHAAGRQLDPTDRLLVERVARV